MSTFGIRDSGLKSDIAEWIGDGIELIGYHVGFVNKVSRIPVVNNTVELPCDYFVENFLTHNKQKLHKGYLRSTCVDTAQLPEVDKLYTLIDLHRPKDVALCDYESIALNFQSAQKEVNNTLEWVTRKSRPSKQYFYKEGVNCFKTNVEDGDVIFLFYKAFPTDKEGLPMIVDEVNYRTALSYYCMQRLMLQGYQHPVLKFADLLMLSDKWIAKARNNHLKLTWEGMESFKNNWTNMMFTLKTTNNYFTN